MRMFRSVFTLAAAALFCLASPLAQAQPSAIPRTADGKPDFSGFFDIQYTPNMALGKEDAIPYTPAGRAAYRNHDAKDDPTANCWLPGVPRIMQSPYPAQFVQTPDRLVILFEYMHTFRSIPLNATARSRAASSAAIVPRARRRSTIASRWVRCGWW